MVRIPEVEDLPNPDVYEKQMGKFRAKGLLCFEEITDYSLLDDKLAETLKRKADESSEQNGDKKKKLKTKLNDSKLKIKKEKTKKAKKVKSSEKLDKPAPKELPEEKKILTEAELEAAKKLKIEKKQKKNANRKKRKEKRDAKLKEKKTAKSLKTMKTNSTSRMSIHTGDNEEVDSSNMIEKMKGWDDMMLPNVLLRALYDKGFYNPMPIQKMVLPEAINKRSNIIGTAQTGSGKTLAFGLPILTHLIDTENASKYMNSLEETENSNEQVKEKAPQALILTPTRELAIQIKEHLQAACKYQKTKIVVVVGGISQMKQERLLKQEPEIIVATPGRLMMMIDEGNEYLNKIGQIKYLVIDEADRMIEKGHFGEVEKLLKIINDDELLKKKRQNFLFSATLITKFQDDIKNEESIMKPRTDEQLQRELKAALNSLVEKVQMTREPKVYDLTTVQVTAENLIESKLFCSKTEKDIYLFYFAGKYVGRTLVFANSIDCVRRLTNLFKILKKTPLQLHANMEQKQRLKNLEKFNAEPNSLMIASDVASRGLDIPNVMNVIHYQTPRTAEIYVHRSGRTARSTNEGLSVMLVSPDEMYVYKKILSSIKKDKDIRDYPIDIDYFDSCKKIVTLARKTDELEHQLNKQKNETNWYEKNAKLLDIDIDDELIKENQVDSTKLQKEKRELAKNKAELAHLLKKPIFPKNFSKNYLATENLDRFKSVNNTNENAIDGLKTTDLANKQKKKNFKLLKGVNQKKKKKNNK